MKRLISMLFISLFLLTSCETPPSGFEIGKHMEVKRQCRLYASPHTFYSLLNIEKARDNTALQRILNGPNVKWIYKKSVVEIHRVKKQLAQIKVVKPTNDKLWWIPLSELKSVSDA